MLSLATKQTISPMRSPPAAGQVHNGDQLTVDSARRVERSLHVRAALEDGWDARAYAVVTSMSAPDPNQLDLFLDGTV